MVGQKSARGHHKRNRGPKKQVNPAKQINRAREYKTPPQIKPLGKATGANDHLTFAFTCGTCCDTGEVVVAGVVTYCPDCT